MVNSFYTKEIIEKAAEHLKKEGSVQLNEILSEDDLRSFGKLKWKHSYYPLKFSLHYSKPPVVWKSVQKLVSALIGKKVQCGMWCIALFQGDYSVLYDALKPGKGFMFMLDISDFDESWGGYTVFLKGDDEVVRIVPRRNSFTIVNQSGLKFFHKYVNHRAGCPRIFLCGVAQAK